MSISVRTLHFAPIKSSMTKAIREYFVGFGKVDYVQLHLGQDAQYGFVQFSVTECAEVVLSQETHCISNCPLTVCAADDCHQPDFKTENWMSPPQQDSNILVSLNDDCLREIFLRLKLLDLCQAVEVCVRFSQVASGAFAINYKHLKLEEHTLKITDRLKTSEVKKMLSNFGSLIHSLYVDKDVVASTIYGAPSFILLRLISQFCTLNLKELELVNFDISRNFPDELYPLFAKLERLTFNSCDFILKLHISTSLKKLLSTCNELKMLGFKNCKLSNWECIARHYPNLEEIHLIENKWLDDDDLSKFIILNPTLTKLSIKEKRIDVSVAFCSLGENLDSLTELELNCSDFGEFQSKIRYLGRLRSLKMLKLNFKSNRIVPLMAALATNHVPIEHLRIHNGKIDLEAIDYISQLKQITILEIDVGSDLINEHLSQLAKELPQLRELHLNQTPSSITTIGLKKIISYANKLSVLKLKTEYSIMVDVDDYKAMLKSVQDRPERVNLLIELTSDESQVNVPGAILLENRDLFNIVEHCIDFDDSDQDWTNSDDSDGSEYYSDSDYTDYNDYRNGHYSNYDHNDHDDHERYLCDIGYYHSDHPFNYM